MWLELCYLLALSFGGSYRIFLGLLSFLKMGMMIVLVPEQCVQITEMIHVKNLVHKLILCKWQLVLFLLFIVIEVVVAATTLVLQL